MLGFVEKLQTILIFHSIFGTYIGVSCGHTGLLPPLVLTDKSLLDLKYINYYRRMEEC